MLFSGSQLITNLLNENRLVKLGDSVLPLFRRTVGIHILKLLGRHKFDMIRQISSDIFILIGHIILRYFQSLIYGLYDQLQILPVSVFLIDNLLPIPLVYINGMDVVRVLVPADSAHIGVKTFTHAEAVLLQRQTFPLCKGMDNLGRTILLLPDSKLNRAFHAV